MTALTMVAFAANSVLNRLALVDGGMDAMAFGAVRLASGALTLAVLTMVLRGYINLKTSYRPSGVISLLVYIFGFSLAYLALDAGLGALILFGTVQITMFAGALIGGERVAALRWVGAVLAFAGVVWLLLPVETGSARFSSVLLMAAAGVGWGVYSLVGRVASDALSATAANFVIAAPLALLLLPFTADTNQITGYGIALACLSGAVTSGLGYALWYHLLPKLRATTGALAQLTVPAIALGGGMIFLGEALTAKFAFASLLILGGIGVSLLASKR